LIARVGIEENVFGSHVFGSLLSKSVVRAQNDCAGDTGVAAMVRATFEPSADWGKLPRVPRSAPLVRNQADVLVNQFDWEKWAAGAVAGYS
jgi:hypothetical protein